MLEVVLRRHLWQTHAELVIIEILRDHSYCAILSECDCNSSYRNKWVVQDLIEVFTLCNCDNIMNSYLAHHKQKQIAVAIREKTHSVNESLKSKNVTQQ